MHTMTQHSVPYASGVGLLNCDLLFSGLPRLPVDCLLYTSPSPRDA